MCNLVRRGPKNLEEVAKNPVEKIASNPVTLSGPVLRDAARLYLSDPPLLRVMGFLVSQHGQLGAIPPPPSLSVSHLESMQSGGAIPPQQKKRGISAILARYPMKTRQNACDTPLCDTISKGYCAIWGGISHWAAKLSRLWLSWFFRPTKKKGHSGAFAKKKPLSHSNGWC